MFTANIQPSINDSSNLGFVWYEKPTIRVIACYMNPIVWAVRIGCADNPNRAPRETDFDGLGFAFPFIALNLNECDF